MPEMLAMPEVTEVTEVTSLPAMQDLAQQAPGVGRYQALAAITRAMLAAARAEDWDNLVALEATCAAMVKSLQQGEMLAPLSSQQEERKATLIEQMLADDGELRRLVAARMAQLSNQLHSTSTERKLVRAYEA
jgi:flagellar protein FliT